MTALLEEARRFLIEEDIDTGLVSVLVPTGRGGYCNPEKCSIGEFLDGFDRFAKWLEKNPQHRREGDETSHDARADLERLYDEAVAFRDRHNSNWRDLRSHDRRGS